MPYFTCPKHVHPNTTAMGWLVILGEGCESLGGTPPTHTSYLQQSRFIMTQVLHIDFETRSRCDIRDNSPGGAKVEGREPNGLYNYATSSTTDVLCMAYCFESGQLLDRPEVAIATPTEGVFELPDIVTSHINSGGTICAHNAAFERLIMKHVLGVDTKFQQWQCTSILSRIYGGPASLDGAAEFMNLPVKKMSSAAMMKLCKPMASGSYYDKEDLAEVTQEMYHYCKTDVEVQVYIWRALKDLWTPWVEEAYSISEKINDRGVTVDMSIVENALSVATLERARSSRRVSELTSGEITSTYQNVGLTKYLRGLGVDANSVNKEAVAALLRRDDLPLTARALLDLRVRGSETSPAKFRMMQNISVEYKDGFKINGGFTFYGAHTGRYSGRGVQMQNLPRGRSWVADNGLNELAASMLGDPDMLREMFGDDMLATLKDCLRPALVAGKGRVLVGCDYSAIEARGLAWLAGDVDKMDLFRRGGKLYETTASKIFGVPIDSVTKSQRHIGKTAELAYGYQGGERAYFNFAPPKAPASLNEAVLDSDLSMEDSVLLESLLKTGKWDVAKIEDAIDEVRDITSYKQSWRGANVKTVALWKLYDTAAINAVRSGTPIRAGRCVFVYNPASKILCVVLPSGRRLNYPGVALVDNRFGRKSVTYAKPLKTDIRNRGHMYGGKWAENITQAVCADLLIGAMVECESLCMDVVIHVHDEIVVEVHNSEAAEVERRLVGIMSRAPDWAKCSSYGEFPLSAESWIGGCFRK